MYMCMIVYPEAEVLFQDEDTQPLETPIIAPVKNKKFAHIEMKGIPETSFKFKYVYMYVCICMYMYVHVCICVCVCIFTAWMFMLFNA